jgi:hypothetical protein
MKSNSLRKTKYSRTVTGLTHSCNFSLRRKLCSTVDTPLEDHKKFDRTKLLSEKFWIS